MNWLEQEKAKAAAEGWDAAEFPHAARLDALKALKFLPEGRTLEEAAQFFAAHLLRTQRTLSAAEAVEQFLGSKRLASPTHLRDLRIRLNRWLRTVPADRTIDRVTTEELAKFLEAFQALLGGLERTTSCATLMGPTGRLCFETRTSWRRKWATPCRLCAAITTPFLNRQRQKLGGRFTPSDSALA